MLGRCENPSDKDYYRYGGEGITVCAEWHSLEGFADSMGPRPSPAHSIDRLKGTLGYTPDNCRWATPKEQARNRKSNHLVLCKGQRVTITEAGEMLGMSHWVIRRRLKAGWSESRAVNTPLLKQGGQSKF